jgi:predicted ABC-class ATPase
MPAADAVPFLSPPSLAVEVDLPHAGRVRGMGVRAGVTLIVGGGFHGKSTLLAALQSGVYDKAPGDGRERVATVAGAVKVGWALLCFAWVLRA